MIGASTRSNSVHGGVVQPDSEEHGHKLGVAGLDEDSSCTLCSRALQRNSVSLECYRGRSMGSQVDLHTTNNSCMEQTDDCSSAVEGYKEGHLLRHSRNLHSSGRGDYCARLHSPGSLLGSGSPN